MYEILENLDLSEEISKKKLLRILKRESDSIHITDIMTSYVQLVEDGKYVQSGYRREYLEAYIKGFLMRVKEIRDDKAEYGDGINIKEFQEAFKTLKEQEKMVEKEEIT